MRQGRVGDDDVAPGVLCSFPIDFQSRARQWRKTACSRFPAFTDSGLPSLGAASRSAPRSRQVDAHRSLEEWKLRDEKLMVPAKWL